MREKEDEMKRHLMILSVFVLFVVNCGCATIYKTAVDERSVSTIASDTRIKAEILEGFVKDDTIKTLDISAACFDGHVYLAGEYETEKQKNRAIEVAKKTDGVKDVTTYLLRKKKDDSCGIDDNVAITAKVKGNLIKDKDIWSTNVEVKSIQCNVVLLGIVGSKEEIQKAILHAKSVEGVRSVKSFLRSAK